MAVLRWGNPATMGEPLSLEQTVASKDIYLIGQKYAQLELSFDTIPT